MVRSVWLPAALGVVLSCGPDPVRQESDPASAESSDARAVLEDSLRTAGLHLRFWLTDSIPPDLAAHFAPWDGACGLTAGASITSMPAENHPFLGGDEAVEFAEDGSIVRRWYIPIQTVLAGVQADTILLDFRHKEVPYVLGVTPDGRLSIRDRPSEWPALVDCPSKTGFEDSGYFRCFLAVDETSGAQRFLGYQPPCT